VSARTWWLVEAGPLSPAGTMALDEALLRRAIEARRPDPVVRVYAWTPPALSVGAKIDLPPPVRGRCKESGVEVVRRATGGGCVLHYGDVTYSVVARLDGRSVLDAYRWVAGGLIAGLALLGLEAAVAEHPVLGRPLDCFRVATGADLEVGGHKICGSAQVRRQGWFLQHGSIPLADIREKAAWLLGGGADAASTCLEKVRPGTNWDEAAEALVAGFAAAWGSAPGRRSPDPREWRLGGELDPLDVGCEGDGEGVRQVSGLRHPLGMV
jgi:lipoate-protein ligase A